MFHKGMEQRITAAYIANIFINQYFAKIPQGDLSLLARYYDEDSCFSVYDINEFYNETTSVCVGHTSIFNKLATLPVDLHNKVTIEYIDVQISVNNSILVMVTGYASIKRFNRVFVLTPSTNNTNDSTYYIRNDSIRYSNMNLTTLTSSGNASNNEILSNQQLNNVLQLSNYDAINNNIENIESKDIKPTSYAAAAGSLSAGIKPLNPLIVDYSEMNNNNRRDNNGIDEFAIFIRNPPTDEQATREWFSKFGIVVECTYKGHIAFLAFDSPLSVQKAIESSTIDPQFFNGERMTVEMKRTNRERTFIRGRGRGRGTRSRGRGSN